VVERRLHRIGHVVGQVELRAQLVELVAEHEPGVHAEPLVDLGPLPLHAHGRVRVGERQVPERREHHVEVELGGQAAVELHRALVERDPSAVR
jgi:hypothetical protein